jgi:hypothetical protein
LPDGTKYQVGSYLPGRIKAESYAASDTFDAAFQWIEDRLRENPMRTGRVFTYETITPEQAKRLRRYRLERIG